MAILIQGMRRSGTTIIYDALCQERSVSAWYEPLAAARYYGTGGGSGMQNYDLFEPLRQARREFAQAHSIDDTTIFNYGSPHSTELEFEETLPDIVSDYLGYLINRPGPVVAKFTRAYCKVQELSNLAPTATFVHVIRDPRAVTTSFLFAKNQKKRAQLPTADVFFGRKSNLATGRSRRLVACITQQSGWARYADVLDFEHILVMWKFMFEETHRRGLAAYGDRYLMVRHEDLCHDPAGTLRQVYKLEGRPLPEEVKNWATKNIRFATSSFMPADQRWNAALERLDMTEALSSAGYSEAMLPCK